MSPADQVPGDQLLHKHWPVCTWWRLLDKRKLCEPCQVPLDMHPNGFASFVLGVQ